MRTITFFTAVCMGIGFSTKAQSRVIPCKANAVVRLSFTNSEVTITGYDSSAVTITDLQDAAGEKGLTVTDKSGTVTIRKSNETRGKFLIKVPRKADLYYEEEMREPARIVISDVAGKTEVRSWVSEIRLKNVTGPIKAISRAGDISVVWTATSTLNNSTFETPGRAVKLILPATARVDLNLDVTSGRVTSEFDLGAENKAALLDVGSQRYIRHKINGGNTDIKIKANQIDIQQAKG